MVHEPSWSLNYFIVRGKCCGTLTPSLCSLDTSTNMLFNRRSNIPSKELLTPALLPRVMSAANVEIGDSTSAIDLAAVASLSLSAVVKRRSSSRRRSLLPANKCRPHSWHPTLLRGSLRTDRSRSSGRGEKWIDSSILDGITIMSERVTSTPCRQIFGDLALFG